MQVKRYIFETEALNRDRQFPNDFSVKDLVEFIRRHFDSGQLPMDAKTKFTKPILAKQCFTFLDLG